MTEDRSSDDTVSWWDTQYANLDEVPWDTDDPQAAIVGRSDSDDIVGRVLDIGCGLGTESLYLAEQGHTVVGVDFSAEAVDRARARAADRSLKSRVRFETGDAFRLSEMDVGKFDTIVDCGMLHTLESADRIKYTESLTTVLSADGRAVFVEFGEEAPEDWGPNPLSTSDIRRAFDDRWRVDVVESCTFETRQGGVPGILSVTRLTQ